MTRTILHVDMNSYFATVEQQANPLLRGKPIAVSGRPHIHSVVAAASIEAKKFGVKSGMNTYEAQKICPSLIFIPGDPEKYISLTGHLLRIFRSYTPLIEIFSIDEVFMELGDPGLALIVAQEIKTRIRQEIGVWMTCSIGVAENKFLAKLASEKKKPDGLTVVTPNNLNSLLLGSKLDDFCGIGRRVLARLEGMGIHTVAQLRRVPLDCLLAAFGTRGKILHDMSFGRDDSPLIPEYEQPDPKSFSHTLTLSKATTDLLHLEAILLRLSEKVARRMRSDNLCGRVIHAYAARPENESLGGQKALSYYTDDGWEIFEIGRQILNLSHNSVPVRALGIGIGQLLPKNFLPVSFLPEKLKAAKIISSMDLVNNHFGENTVFRAAILPAFPREKNVAGIRLRLRFN